MGAFEYIKGKWHALVRGLFTIEASDILVPTDLQSRYSQTTMTHNGVTVNGSASTARVEVNTKGYSQAVLMKSGTGICVAYAQIVLSNGTILTSTFVSTANNSADQVTFNLNGVEKLSVYGKDTSGASNAITIEVSLLV